MKDLRKEFIELLRTTDIPQVKCRYMKQSGRPFAGMCVRALGKWLASGEPLTCTVDELLKKPTNFYATKSMITMNDKEGKSFKEIADILENDPVFVFTVEK